MGQRAFITGGTGFIGGYVVRQLRAQGYAVTCLARRPSKANALRFLGVEIVPGDVTDKASMRAAMQGADTVFHLAAWYQFGVRDVSLMEQINVGGTQNVLDLALELGVSRIVYVSSTTAFGDTNGQIIDETFQRRSPFFSAYDRTKTVAHEYAETLAAQGSPVIIAAPALVYGPDDPGQMGWLARMYLRRRLPVALGPEGAFNHTHVEDVAAGILLAAERGQDGQTYILSGEPLQQREMFALWQRLTGIPAPRAYAPRWLAWPFLAILEGVARLIGREPPLSREAAATGYATWLSASAKAQRELGWSFRSAETGWRETLNHERARPGKGTVS
ncbi:MAG: NAD-dependent epimerase/dehydratase family protein [Anaerolineae bacterium]